ncbi:MAG: very short patch repair endonuclease, partial [Phycisphaerae bacterium]|nr:very short patch repair endonuclease [Phycisphaerae bacterium]
MDNLTTKQRSRQISLVRAKDTKPEMTVRRLVHALGYRYRLHVKDLPGC